MKNETNVFFYISSFDPLDMAEITKTLGLEPSRVRAMSETTDEPGKLATRHTWQLLSALPTSKHVNDHIEAFIALLQPRAETLKILTDRLSAGIHCQLTRHNEPEEGGYRDVYLALWQPTIKLLAALNLSFTIDYFFL